MLSDITVLVTTFLRPGYLRESLKGVGENLKEVEVSVACDDELMHAMLFLNPTAWTRLQFDSGLTAKRNAAVKRARTKYCLLSSDDFDFSTPGIRDGILRMSEFLDKNADVDVVVGRVNNKQYEGYLEYVPGEYIKEYRLVPKRSGPIRIDIGINFFLARTSVLREIPWDERIRPIGGEHADWFLSMREAHKTVIFMPDVNINTLPYKAEWQHPDYKAYRCRAIQGHEIFLRKRGVKRYYSFDEEVQ